MNANMQRKRAEEVIVLLREMFGDGMEFICSDAYRTNRILTSIALYLPHCDTLPTVYMEDMPESASVEEIAAMAAARFQEILRGLNHDGQQFPSMTRENVLENVFFQAISRKRNRQLLRHHPHFCCMDLAGVFRIPAGDYDNGFLNSVLISDVLATGMHLTLEELTEAAYRNTVSKFGVELTDVSERNGCSAQGMVYPAKPFERARAPKPDTYVLTNKININGAALMLIPEVLEQVSEKIGTNYYILPTSIHDVLIVKDGDVSLPRQLLKSVIRGANHTGMVAPDSVLSDNIYYYTQSNKTLRIV